MPQLYRQTIISLPRTIEVGNPISTVKNNQEGVGSNNPIFYNPSPLLGMLKTIVAKLLYFLSHQLHVNIHTRWERKVREGLNELWRRIQDIN